MRARKGTYPPNFDDKRLSGHDTIAGIQSSRYPSPKEAALGLFRRAKPLAHPLAETAVWIVPLHVKEGTEKLPPPLIGAFVTVLCRGDNPSFAAWAAIQAVEAMGYSVVENPKTVHQMPASHYASFISNTWPGLEDQLPSQAEFYERLADNRATMGPFGGYETSAR